MLKLKDYKNSKASAFADQFVQFATQQGLSADKAEAIKAFALDHPEVAGAITAELTLPKARAEVVVLQVDCRMKQAHLNVAIFRDAAAQLAGEVHEQMAYRAAGPEFFFLLGEQLPEDFDAVDLPSEGGVLQRAEALLRARVPQFKGAE